MYRENIKTLKSIFWGHTVITLIAVTLWVLYLVFFMKEYAVTQRLVSPLEILAYTLNISIFSYIIYLRFQDLHELIRRKVNQATSVLFANILVYLVYLGAKLGVVRALNSILDYLPYDSFARHYEIIVIISTNLLPIFVAALTFEVIFCNLNFIRDLNNCEEQMEIEGNLDLILKEETEADNANNY